MKIIENPPIDYEEYAKKYKKYRGPPLYNLIIEKVEAEPILDVGCGGGDFLSMLKKKFKDIEGIELSKRATDLCKQRGLKVKNISIERFEPKRKYNSIILIGVLAHLYDYESCLKKISQMLLPSGRLYLVIPNPHSLKIIFGVLEPLDKNPAYLHLPTYLEFKKVLKKHGFKTIYVSGGGKLKNFPYFSSTIFFVVEKIKCHKNKR